MSFWDFLRSPAASKGKAALGGRPATSAELAEALAEARTAAGGSAARAAEVAERRQQLLLGGSDAQIDAVDAELATANRAVDKTEAAVAALEARLTEAEDAERAAAIDRIHGAGADALSDGLAAYGEYALLAPQVAALGRRMADAQAAIDQANARLRRAGDPRTVAGLDETARPNRSSYQTLRRALWATLVLPCPTRPFDSVWPPYVTEDLPPAPEQPPPRPSEEEPYARTPRMARW